MSQKHCSYFEQRNTSARDKYQLSYKDNNNEPGLKLIWQWFTKKLFIFQDKKIFVIAWKYIWRLGISQIVHVYLSSKRICANLTF